MEITAQQAASRRYHLKHRKGKARLPAIYLSDEEVKMLDELAKIYGSKKQAILEAMKLLYQY